MRHLIRNIVVNVVVLVGLIALLTISWRHDMRRVDDNNWECYKALHVEFPGWETHYDFSKQWDLKDYASGEKEEIKLGNFLKDNFIKEAKLERNGGHWRLIIVKPIEYFTWRSFYRIGPWHRDSENDHHIKT